MRKIFTFSMGLFFALSSTNSAEAQLLINENFTGYSSGNLSGQGGWQVSGTGTDVQVVGLSNNSGAVFHPGYTSGTSYINTSDAGGTNPFKLFLGGQSVPTSATSSFYLTFLVRVNNSGLTANTSNALPSLALRTSNNENLGNFYIASSGNNIKFGISKNEPGNGGGAFANDNFAVGVTYLIVIRYDMVSGVNNDQMYLFVDPGLAAEPLTTSAIKSLTNGSDGAYSGNVNSLQLLQQNKAAKNSAAASFDAFRLSYAMDGATVNANSALAWSDLSAAGTVLPVHFSSFSAARENAAVTLSWKVDAEENLSGYEIQRSSNGNNFERIGYVTAAARGSYAYADAQALQGKSFYRIKSVDLNNRYAYSNVLGMNGGKAQYIIKAFPSPVQKQLTVQHAPASALARLSISTEDGRLVKNIIPAAGSLQTIIDLSAEKPGLYLLRFDNGDGKTETLKLVKQ